MNTLEKISTVFKETLSDSLESAKLFVGQDYTDQADDEEVLANAYFSHKLKLLMESFNQNIEALLNDPIVHFRKSTLSLWIKLAKKVPFFQKQSFIQLIVNKIGDLDYSTSQLVLKYISISITKANPTASLVILEWVNRMLSRPNLSQDTKFSLITWAANLKFEEVLDSHITNTCCKIFMKEFIANWTTKDESLSKIMNQCIRGLNKSLPFLKDKVILKTFYEEHTDRLFGLSHNAKLRVRVQILLLLFQILKTEPYSKQMDRFYKVVYSMLLDPTCLHSSITELFLELLFNACKVDHSHGRTWAWLKRLLQNAIHAEANVAVAALLFVNKLAIAKPGLSAQILSTSKSGINGLLNDDDQDNEETTDDKNKVHNKEDENLELGSGGYDFLKRDPLFSKAENTLLWELGFFIDHYHPTVQKIAANLIENLSTKKNTYGGNPLLDFSFASFLDRFWMKKPRQSKVQARKKLLETNKMSRSKTEEPFSIQQVMNSSSGASGIRDEEQFMYTYFKKKIDALNYNEKLEKRRAKRQAASKKDGSDPDDDEDRFADELFEQELKKGEAMNDENADEYLDDFIDDEDLDEDDDQIMEELDVDQFDADLEEDFETAEAPMDDEEFEDDHENGAKKSFNKSKKKLLQKRPPSSIGKFSKPKGKKVKKY